MQTDISVLVIEDDEIWAHKIAYDLDQFGFKLTYSADNFEDALTAVHQNHFDIALVDININGKNSGIDLGKLITHVCRKPFIFLTGSLDDIMMRDVALARPSAFLTKPVTPTSLFISMQSAIHHFHSGSTAIPVKNPPIDNTFFFVKHGNKYKKIEWKDVVCLRSERNYTSIITSEHETYLIRSSLHKTLRDIIPEKLKDNFLQINRAEILQVSYIDELMGDEAMIGQQGFNVSDFYVKHLKQQLNIIL